MRACRLVLVLLAGFLVPGLLSGCGNDPGTYPGEARTARLTASSEAPSLGEFGDLSGEPLLAAVNQDLARRGLPVAVAKAEFLVKPGFEAQGRTLFASDRFKRLGERWVPGDARRLAQGNSLTYLTVMSAGAANPGIPATETEAAIDRCFTTWEDAAGCASLDLVKRPDTGADATIVDFYLEMGDLGDPFLADIVNAGFVPGEFFERLVTDGSRFILAVTFTLVFVDDYGYPTDLDRNHEYDTALAEVYYNNEFRWTVTGTGGVDIETVALHENGHTLGLGHFGNIFLTDANSKLHIAPRAVMNAVYVGPLRVPQRTDLAGLCGEYANWP